ncbi:MAG: MBL fold metallo-hydrolase [Bacteroidales bacterium]|nr:MBL fold metallo-hydrolase [Bacteroidales bacterium]
MNQAINAGQNFEKDTVKTNTGEIVITFVGHGTLYLNYNGITIHIDPVDRYADYTNLPKADIILVTHHHGDHFSKQTIDLLLKTETKLILTELCAEKFNGKSIVMNNGDRQLIDEIEIQAVPAYNIVHMRDDNTPYHPKGEGNGYVISIDDKKIYVAGDTENIPEMEALKGLVDIAFLPMNLPYTMTPEMVFDAVRLIEPKILYPYHYGNTDLSILEDLMKGDNCELRIRDMK